MRYPAFTRPETITAVTSLYQQQQQQQLDSNSDVVDLIYTGIILLSLQQMRRTNEVTFCEAISFSETSGHSDETRLIFIANSSGSITSHFSGCSCTAAPRKSAPMLISESRFWDKVPERNTIAFLNTPPQFLSNAVHTISGRKSRATTVHPFRRNAN